jgi:DNA-binding GntR family transcriptional regulator
MFEVEGANGVSGMVVDQDKLSDLSLEALRSFYDDEEASSGSKKSRLYDTCLKMIEKGFWNPGDRLPTDIVLAENLPVSLGTVQAVFRRLKDERLITRNKRQGSFLAAAEVINRDYRFFAFWDDDRTIFIQVEIEKFSIECVAEQGPWSNFLGKARKYIKITRTANVGGEFRLFSELYLSLSRFDSILQIPQDELAQSGIIQVLQVHFGTPTLKTDWTMRFAYVEKGQAKNLHVKLGATAALFDVCGYTLRDKPVLFHRILVPHNDRQMNIVT